MRRVVVHEILVGTGIALLLVAALATGAAQRSLMTYRDQAAALRATVDSLAVEGGEHRDALGAAARQLAEAEFNVRATLQLRARLWQPGGMGTLTAIGGVLALGAGVVAWRRRAAGGRG